MLFYTIWIELSKIITASISHLRREHGTFSFTCKFSLLNYISMDPYIIKPRYTKTPSFLANFPQRKFFTSHKNISLSDKYQIQCSLFHKRSFKTMFPSLTCTAARTLHSVPTLAACSRLFSLHWVATCPATHESQRTSGNRDASKRHVFMSFRPSLVPTMSCGLLLFPCFIRRLWERCSPNDCLLYRDERAACVTLFD